MKKIFLAALLALSLPAMAQNSGVLYDEDRNGEGLIWVQHGQHVVAFIFTYGKERCEDIFGPAGWLETCDDNGQRWFMISGDALNANQDTLSGILYATEGLDWPIGQPIAGNPFGNDVADSPIPVGTYIAQRSGDGWKIIVIPLVGSGLDPDDPLFERVWNFTTSLFPATD